MTFNCAQEDSLGYIVRPCKDVSWKTKPQKQEAREVRWFSSSREPRFTSRHPMEAYNPL